MTAAAATGAAAPPASPLWQRIGSGSTVPVLVIVAALIVLWYAGAAYLNAPRVMMAFSRTGAEPGWAEFLAAVWSMDRPVLPAPDQVAVDLWNSVTGHALTSPRNLLWHTYVTMSAAFVGFVMGTALGILIAVGIVHVQTLDRSLMPWVIASQTVPILAIAPMIVVVLGNMGITGLVPKSVISAYLCFFPVAIGMVKGLRSPDPLQRDLMRTYNAGTGQLFFKLRWPSSMPFLFPSLKVGIALSIVGAIVGELPTGAQAGIGARLLMGSYYGQITAMWSALVMSGLLAMACILAVSLAEKLLQMQRGGRL